MGDPPAQHALTPDADGVGGDEVIGSGKKTLQLTALLEHKETEPKKETQKSKITIPYEAQ